MARVQRALRERALDLVLGRAGVAGHTIAAHRFSDGTQRQLPEEGGEIVERSAWVVLERRRPQTGYTDPLCGQGLYLVDLSVQVTYALHRQGSEGTWEAAGGDSGGASLEDVEDRAADDAQVLLACLGYQPNWGDLTQPRVLDPACIDPTPAFESSGVEFFAESATLTVSLQILHRADQYTGFGPTITP